jgi:acid-sensing ion channel, other
LGRKFKYNYNILYIHNKKHILYTVSLTTEDQDTEDFKYGSKVIIALDRLPNERLKRNVVRSRMDLIGMLHFINKLLKIIIYVINNLFYIVSIGGTLGLFLGVSLLSIVEIVYFFVVWTHKKPQSITNNVKSKKQVHRSIQNTNNLPFLH